MKQAFAIINNSVKLVPMSELPATELHPYLNPAYWDDHMLGDGQLAPLDPGSFVGPYFGRTMRFAKQTLRDRLESMHTYWPLQSYGRGDTLDPEDWAPGTIALFDRETLRQSKHCSPFNADVYKPLAIPPRPTDLHPHLGIDDYFGTTVHKDMELGVTYLRTTEWGVVAPTKGGRKAFQRVSTSMTWKRPSGEVVTGPFLPQMVPIELGETRHTIQTQDELLTRVNILHVCLVGSEQRQRQKALSRIFLGRFATGHA